MMSSTVSSNLRHGGGACGHRGLSSPHGPGASRQPGLHTPHPGTFCGTAGLTSPVGVRRKPTMSVNNENLTEKHFQNGFNEGEGYKVNLKTEIVINLSSVMIPESNK